MFNAFLSGSHVYGFPRPTSDVDLVVYMPQDEIVRLCEIVEHELSEFYPNDLVSLKFGNLNLICISDELYFNRWRDATAALEKKRPLQRNDAVNYFIQNVTSYAQSLQNNDLDGLEKI